MYRPTSRIAALGREARAAVVNAGRTAPEAAVSASLRWPAAMLAGMVQRLRAAACKARYQPERHYMRGRSRPGAALS